MRIAVIGVLAIALIAGVTVIGCGPQAGVAKDKIISQINKVLGELDVKRKSIEQKQAKIRADLSDLREKRIGTQVRLEQLEKKKEASEKHLDNIKGQIARLIERGKEVSTAEGGKITVGGTEYSAEDINEIATRLQAQHKAATATVASFDSSITALSNSVKFLTTAEKKAKEAMVKLDGKIQEIDGKKIAIDAVKSATEIGNNDQSILDRIESLDKEIDGMFVDVETAMRVEQDKLDSMQTEQNSADALLAEPVNLESKLDDLQKLIDGGGE